MENPPSSAVGALNLGVAAYEAGQLDEARALFTHALLLDHERELAWLWFATVATDPAEQRYCLNRALAINPESPGRRRLAQLSPGPAVTPPELLHVDTPPLPPDLAASDSTRPRLLRPALPHPRRLLTPRFTRAHRPHVVQPGRKEEGERAAPAGAGADPPWRRWLPWLIGGLALLLLAVAAVLLRPAGGLASEPYRIAFAGPLSGPDAKIGREQLHGVELALDAVNRQGGIGGRPIALLTFDDQNDPALAAERAAAIAANDDILLVIGHHRSPASIAAAPVYAEAGLAAITPSSTADALTEDNPWYFRTVLPNHEQGKFVAAYVRHALGHDRASIITIDGVYETSLRDAFAAEFGRSGTIVREWQIDRDDHAASIATIVDELAATENPGIVFLPLSPEDAREVLLVLRRSGSDLSVIGGDALGHQGFAQRFAGEPEEAVHPGYFTHGLDVVSTLMYDGLGGKALTFARQFEHAYGTTPEWYGAKAHDAATLAIHALTSLRATAEAPATATARRQLVRDALAANDRLETAIDGLGGPLYFDAERAVPQMLSFGVFDRGLLLNAPRQYRPVTEPEKFDLEADRAAGLLFDLDGMTFRQYRVVYVGVDLNEVSNLDPQAETFDADLYLWFRYVGDDRAERILFTNATDSELALDAPLDQAEDEGQHFVIYRVETTFFEPMDFRNYPWDRHMFTIGMQNRNLTNADVVYVPDPMNLRQSQDSRLRSAVDATQPFNHIPGWIAERVDFIQGSAMARSTTPDPRTGAPEYDLFSTYQVEIEYVREVRPFLIKNLLPLALLALVTYISLYFAPENAGTRIGFSVTSILTSSVLLQAVSGNLPDIGYTVAIEWGYYVYIALSAVLVLVNIVIDRWFKQKRYGAVRRLEIVARVLYPLIIAAVVVVYLIRYW